MPEHTPPSADTRAPGIAPDQPPARPKRRAPRWVARRIWRAFPELDDYTDKECVAFIRAARRGWRRRIARLMLFVLGAGAAFGGGFAGIGLVMLLDGDPRSVRGGPSEALMMTIAFTSMVVGIGGATSVVMLVRDWLLQRWIRHILGTRGRCGSCGYSFVGLVIPDSCRLLCPECGVEGRVDASLTVLTRADAQPVRTVTHEQPVYWTRIRVRTWLRCVGVAAAACVAALLVLVGVMEYRVYSHVAQARADMPTSQDFSALLQEMRPGARLTPQPLVQQRATETASALKSLEASAQSGMEKALPLGPLFMYESVVPSSRDAAEIEDMTKRSSGTAAAYRALALKVLTEAESAGVWKALRAALLETYEVRDMALPPEQIYTAPIDYLSPARFIADALCARARLAVSRHDGAVAAESLSTLQLLARHVGEQPLPLELLSGSALQVRTNDTLQRWLMSKPTAEELDLIEQSCVPLAIRGDPTLRIRYESLCVRAYLAWLFSNPRLVRELLYLGEPLTSSNPFGAEPLRWGTWQENADFLSEALEDALESPIADLPNQPADLLSAPSFNEDEPPLLAEALTQGGPPVLRHNFWTDVPAMGIRTMVALERCRLKRGGYPERLEELVPDFMPAVPVGEKTGAPLGYKRLEPGTDALERPYLLYAPGRDGKENGILNRSNPIPR
ncbi:MAG: hypothetical protein U0636_07045 [Phycisphaerales bacterium]